MRDFKRSYEIRERLLGDQDVNSIAVRGNLMLVLTRESMTRSLQPNQRTGI